MGVHIAVDGGDVFFGGGLCWRGRGRGWVLVDTGYLCLFCAFCLSGCWGALFFVGGGGDSVGGEGGGGGCL